MDRYILVQLAVEDTLSEAVLRIILSQSGRPYQVSTCFGKMGSSFLKTHMRAFNNSAKGCPYIVLTDLDKSECAPLKAKEWLTFPKHSNLIFRIAVREVEAWVLAHRSAFARFLGIREPLIPSNPDELDDPKRSLIQLTAMSRKRRLREAITPAKGSTAKIGPDYNNTLSEFVQESWNATEASSNSPSLKRTLNVIASFKPTFSSR